MKLLYAITAVESNFYYTKAYSPVKAFSPQKFTLQNYGKNL